ncbi:MAG: hypothetical protein KME27_06600 [Lyngbya sp. HA4199-MV5]|nr:hypothetical protein [Lyngbya sp. HA4199-MV5]
MKRAGAIVVLVDRLASTKPSIGRGVGFLIVAIAKGRRQRAEGRGQEAEGRRQRAEGRGQNLTWQRF